MLMTYSTSAYYDYSHAGVVPPASIDRASHMQRNNDGGIILEDAILMQNQRVSSIIMSVSRSNLVNLHKLYHDFWDDLFRKHC